MANGSHREGRLDVRDPARDIRVPSRDGRADRGQEDGTQPTILDMDFFPSETGEQSRGRLSTSVAHVFGQTESHRTQHGEASAQDNAEDQGFERARRRAAGLPIIYE